MPHLKYTTLDVFTTTRYTGNPVSIISLPSTTTLTQAQKQYIALEFNLSEIVFLHLPVTPSTSRTIDIFTSIAEVPFAGHPTIGIAWDLLQILKEDVSTLITKAGPIPISFDKETGVVNAKIPFNYHLHAHTVPCALTAEKQHPVASIVNGTSFIYVELPSISSLSTTKTIGNGGNLNKQAHNPDFLDEGWRNGLVGTMYFVKQGEDEFGRKKYRTRMFGSREDPGTGSASSGLGRLLSEREGGKGIYRYAFEQGVEMGRRNEISVEVTWGNDGIEGVVLSGKGVQVMKGELEV